jgi:hypothetical protein
LQFIRAIFDYLRKTIYFCFPKQEIETGRTGEETGAKKIASLQQPDGII